MRKYIVIAFLLLLIPSFVFAKNAHPKGYEHAQGQSMTVSDPLGWPISLRTSSYNNVSLESLPGMAVIRMKPYNPWWRFYGSIPKDTITTVSGLPANTDLHIYTKGYRDHEVKHTDANGTLTFSYPSKPGIRIVIKEKPSTKHIRIGGTLFFPTKGGDCSSIGSWDETAKTCTLTKDVFESIVIEDSDITLNGNGKSVFGSGSGDGIFTDESGVTVTNIEVHGFAQGIVYADALFTFANGGTINQATVSDNIRGIVDEGISYLTITNSHIVHQTTGVKLVDQLDGHPTDNIVIVRNNLKQNTTDVFNDGTSFSLSNTSNRGNYWEKNTGCIQDTGNPSHCTNFYNSGPATDNLPWVCESGWTRVCPVKPPTTSNTPTPSTSTSTSTPPTASGDWGEVEKKSQRTSTYYDDEALTNPLKDIPNGWAIKIIQEKGTKVKIQDPIDNTIGWMKLDDIKIATAATESAEFARRGESQYATKETRLNALKEILTLIAKNSDTQPYLYTWQAGYVGDPIANHYIPPEFLIAISARESGSKNYDNALVTADYGHGIKQLTPLQVRHDVRYLLVILTAEGHYSNAVKSIESFTINGETAVAAFQKAQSITGDTAGQVSANTIQKLNALIEADIVKTTRKYPDVPSYFRFNDYMRSKTAAHTGVNYVDRGSSSEGRGLKTGLKVYPCADLDTYTDPENIRYCYSGIVTKQYVAQPNYSNRIFQFYNNTHQSIIANIKDGLGVLASKYATYSSALEKKYSTDNTKIIFEDGVGANKVSIKVQDLKLFVAVKAYNGVALDAICPGTKSFPQYPLSNEPVYLSEIANHLRDASIGYANPASASYYAKQIDLAVKNKTSIALCSPAYLQVFDSRNLLTGYDGSIVHHDIYNVVYDDENHEKADILFPADTYHYDVIGKEAGTYSLYVENVNHGSGQVFAAIDIPTTKCARHEYSFDWSLLAKGEQGTTIKIDQDCNGSFETTLQADLSLSADEVSKATKKVLVCHIPSGDISKAKTLSIGASALPAHLKHGDYEGECKTISIKKDEIKKEEAKKEEKTENKNEKKSKEKKS